MDLVMDHSVIMLAECINRGEVGLHEKKLEERVNIVTLLNQLCVIDKNFSERARSHPGLHAMMFYERSRLGCVSTGYYLEGCPPGLPLFSGNCVNNVKDNDIVWIRLRDVISDRLQTIGHLEGMRPNSERRTKLCRDHPLDDIHDSVPGPVRVFVSRVRDVCQALHRNKDANHFLQCQNRCCNRLYYVGGSVDANHVHIGVNRATGTHLSPNEPDSGDEEEPYWQLAMGSSLAQSRKPYYKRFCSTNCRREWHIQLASAMPSLGDYNLDSDVVCRKNGLKRVSEAFRLAMRRNAEAARCIRLLKRDKKIWPAISEKDRNVYVRRRIRMLNLDAGVLYASMQMAATRELSTNKMLAGFLQGWRKEPLYYKRAMKIAMKEYTHAKHNPDNVIGDADTQPVFFVRVKRAANQMF